jgi:RadC-like JAB domain
MSGRVATLVRSCSRKTLALRACLPAPLSCRTHLRGARLRRKTEVFRDAVRQQVAALVAVHNHPSGDPTPSAADVALTEEIVAAGQLLDIELLDHLIIGQRRWLSLKRLGLGFPKA